MKTVVLKGVSALLFLICLLPGKSYCQDLTGIWKGYFVTDGNQTYRLEFQVEQNKNNTVTGVSYSYGDNINFYGKATMTGHYADDNKSFSIQELRTVEVKNPGGGGTCIMNYRFTYSRSGNEEFLEGTYVGKMEDRINPKNNGQWGDCGGGKVFLRRVKESDFYVEPFLRDKPAVKKPDSVTAPPVAKETPKREPAKPPTPKPQTKTASTKPKPQLKTTAVTPKKTVAPPVAKSKTTSVPIKTDTLKRKVQEPITNDKIVERPKINIPAITRSRENELVQTLTVSSEEISVRLYDNGEVDDDTISVYLDGKPLLTNKRLSTVPITLTLKLDPDNPEHVLVMVAENMGRIPPNTSLMIVQDGERRYSVSITSTEQKNAMVRFRYQKKPG
jgi:hypothetical protein